MNPLEDRLRAAGDGSPNSAPDLEAIVGRAGRRHRNRQIGLTLASVAIVAIGAVVVTSYVRGTSPTSIVAAGIGGVTDLGADDASDTSPTESAPEADSANDSDADDGASTPPAAGSTTDTQSVENGDDEAESSNEEPNYGDDADDGADDESDGADEDDDANDDGDSDDDSEDDGRPTASSLADGSGGWLTATANGIRHTHDDGAVSMITFAAPPGGFAQRWPTDVVRLGDTNYLLVDQFINRQDLADERLQALAESYAVPYESDGDMYAALDGVATEQELSEVEHWEVGILAVDLTSDQVVMVENRVINSAASSDWVYNGHITSDGANLLVMRELWQGHCHYVEGLSLNGQKVAVNLASVYPKPNGLDDMTFDDISAVFDGEQPPPQPCLTLAEITDRGVSALGLQADPGEMEAFRTAFGDVGLG